MTTAADAIRSVITPILTGWRVQFGALREDNNTDRFAVIKPAGGGPAELLRRPQYTLHLVGLNGSAAGELATITAAADSVVEALRSASGGIVFLQPGEPVFSGSNARPIFEIAISAITT